MGAQQGPKKPLKKYMVDIVHVVYSICITCIGGCHIKNTWSIVHIYI